MEPLAPADAAWLRMDRPENPMVIAGLFRFAGFLEPERARALLDERLLPLPRFRQRVVDRGGLRHLPAWDEDPAFDLDRHLVPLALPEGAGEDALHALVDDLLSTPLDRAHPLWQLHLIEAPGRGSVLFCRLHHCIADGAALMRVLLSLCEEEPSAATVVPRLPASAQEPTPEGPRRRGRVRETASYGKALGRLVALPPDPTSRFKGALSIHKRAAWSPPLPLDEVKALAHAHDATLNDVLMSATAGAMRRYLLSRGDDVEDLGAMVPVDLRATEEPLSLGNRFGLVVLSLPLEIDAPRARLDEVKRRMERLKRSPEAVVALGVLRAVGRLSPLLEDLVVRFFASKSSVVLTNMRGPSQKLYFAGAPIERFVFWVPESGRIALGVSLLSYRGEVMVGVRCDASRVPDPSALVSAFVDELDALRR